jgi:hypothetical protein
MRNYEKEKKKKDERDASKLAGTYVSKRKKTRASSLINLNDIILPTASAAPTTRIVETPIAESVDEMMIDNDTPVENVIVPLLPPPEVVENAPELLTEFPTELLTENRTQPPEATIPVPILNLSQIAVTTTPPSSASSSKKSSRITVTKVKAKPPYPLLKNRPLTPTEQKDPEFPIISPPASPIPYVFPVSKVKVKTVSNKPKRFTKSMEGALLKSKGTKKKSPTDLNDLKGARGDSDFVGDSDDLS